MMVSNAMPSEASKVTHIQQKSPALPYLHRLIFLWIPWIFPQYFWW